MDKREAISIVEAYSCLLKEHFEFENMYLFGSYARGTNIEDSDILVSWNFKHIVNFDKIKLFNSINIRLGYPMIEIRSPREFVKYENKDQKKV